MNAHVGVVICLHRHCKRLHSMWIVNRVSDLNESSGIDQFIQIGAAVVWCFLQNSHIVRKLIKLLHFGHTFQDCGCDIGDGDRSDHRLVAVVVY